MPRSHFCTAHGRPLIACGLVVVASALSLWMTPVQAQEAASAPPQPAPPLSAASAAGAVLSTAAAGAASSASTAPGRDTWRPGDDTTPYVEWPFPEVQPGALWVPPLRLWQAQTTLIPSPSKDLLSPAETALLAQAQALRQQGKVDEALALLEPADSASASASIAVLVANLRLSDKHPASFEPALALQWLHRAALRDPQFFRPLGSFHLRGQHGLVADPAMAAHWWSLGASRGCHQCVDELLGLGNGSHKGLVIPEDDRLALALFGTDIGSRAAFAYVARRVAAASDAKARTSPAEALALQLKLRAQGLAGHHDERLGGVMLALQRRYRTGLVQRQTLLMLERLKAGQPVEALSAFSQWNGGGRYSAHLIDEALALKPAAGELALGEPARAWAAQEALRHGRLDQGAAVALSYARDREVFRQVGGKLQRQHQKADHPLAWRAYRAAALSGQVDPELLRAVRTEVTVDEARACWRRQYMQARVGYGVLSLTGDQARRVIGAGYGCRKVEQRAVLLTGDPNVLKHPAQHHEAVALMARIDQLQAQRAAEDAQRAEAQLASEARSAPRVGLARNVGGGSGGTVLSSAEASRRAAANVCAWSMNNSRFCK